MVGKLQSRGVGVRVLEVDDNKLFMLICREKQRRIPGGYEAKDISVLRLRIKSAFTSSV